MILGSALGYVLGGVMGRGTVTAVRSAEVGLRETPAEQIVAGVVGAVIGVLVAAGVTWPIFLLNKPVLTFPLFAFVVVAVGLLGYRLGTSKRESVLDMFGAQVGMAERRVAAAAMPRVLDTSVAIDGRIVDVARAGFLHGRMLVPSPVLAELQGLADAGDDARRAKGRRGLEVLDVLRREPGIDVEVLDEEVPGGPRGRRQAGADLPRPDGRAAHPGHQPGAGGRPRRRPGPEPARPGARPAATRRRR